MLCIYDLRTIRCFLLHVIRRFLICHSLPNDSGDKGIRTLDPLLARQVLSQLSYTPIKLLLSKNQNVL